MSPQPSPAKQRRLLLGPPLSYLRLAMSSVRGPLRELTKPHKGFPGYDPRTRLIKPKVWEDSTMSRAKQAPKRKSRACAVPLLGAAGLSLSLASGASAATEVPAADMPTQNTAASHEITFDEEEIADVSLATFYVFDKENVGTSEPTVQLARHWRLSRL